MAVEDLLLVVDPTSDPTKHNENLQKLSFGPSKSTTNRKSIGVMSRICNFILKELVCVGLETPAHVPIGTRESFDCI